MLPGVNTLYTLLTPLNLSLYWPASDRDVPDVVSTANLLPERVVLLLTIWKLAMIISLRRYRAGLIERRGRLTDCLQLLHTLFSSQPSLRRGFSFCNAIIGLFLFSRVEILYVCKEILVTRPARNIHISGLVHLGSRVESLGYRISPSEIPKILQLECGTYPTWPPPFTCIKRSPPIPLIATRRKTPLFASRGELPPHNLNITTGGAPP